MKEVVKQGSRFIDLVFTVCLIFYVWYLGSTLILPLKDLINLPEFVYVTLYSLSAFPPSILFFILGVSLISVISVLNEFGGYNEYVKLFIIEGVTFFLYFIIPLIATIFLFLIVPINSTSDLPTQAWVSYFIEDLFLFSSILFILTAMLNVATQKILESFGCCSDIEEDIKSKVRFKDRFK